MIRQIDDYFSDILNQSSADALRTRRNSVTLLLEQYSDNTKIAAEPNSDPYFQLLKKEVDPDTHIFLLNPVQEEIYHSDSGTAFVPATIKKLLLNIKSRFVVRPVSITDLQKVVQFSFTHKLRYTIRGAGTWPFGGCIPLNHDMIIDLSALDFQHINKEQNLLTVGPGVLFADVRKNLRERGLALCQEITNPNSGTICGWIATGGLGLGTYKYGPVKNSVEALLFIKPDGSLHTLTKNDLLFQTIIGSEGQLGIIAAAVLRIRPLSYVSKPYAFSLNDIEAAQKFLQLIGFWQIRPTSVLYFDPEYMATTYKVGKEKFQKQLNNALQTENELAIRQSRNELETLEYLTDLRHVVVLEFDTLEDYQQALKHQPFSSTVESRRYQDFFYRRLPVTVAHKLWEHRFAPVEMKSKGPAMLVSETILPLEQFSRYQQFIESSISNWTHNPVKIEAHLINDHEMLIQTIILADPDIRRHILYTSLVPLMTQAAIQFGGKSYGVGIWNLPFLSSLSKNGQADFINNLKNLKKENDPHHLINQCKFINTSNRRITLRIFNALSSTFFRKWVRLLHRGKSTNGKVSIYSLGRLLWSGSKKLIPGIFAAGVKAERKVILNLTAACAECDSCERVCPTSDIFGLYGLATPITRRKTANRLARNEKISTEEALGFLVCTRCDNCTHVCPTNIPLTELFDLVEADHNFQQALTLNADEKKEFIDRFWEIMKESPFYRKHTQTDHKGDKSHLEHGLKIHYPRGFAYAKLFIDPDTCIHCGMCAHENACTYDAREGLPRQIPRLIDENCALCNACINYCPQNKRVQGEREFVQNLIDNAVDLDEKKYWQHRKEFLSDTTTIQRSSALTDMADIYLTEEILMEIDKEASTGNIPVSGMGQGDRHMGIGFDAERFSHFHIVGPAQNRLHEGDPDEELSVILGKRHRYCKFDHAGNMHNPPYPKIKLKSPILYNALALDSQGRVELAMMKVCEQKNTLMVVELKRLLENYDYFIHEGKYEKLPPVIIPRVDHELIHHLLVNPHTQRELLLDLWRMPMFELNYHPDMQRTIDYINNSVQSLDGPSPLLCGYISVAEHQMIGGREVLPAITQLVEWFIEAGMDVLHIEGCRNEDHYFVTSQAVRSIHHYLLQNGRRHEIAIMASGGIRLASDSQKTIQRGAEATLIDFAALLALDPYSYRAGLENQTTTEKLLNLDLDWAIKRLTNQLESRKIQILEVLGAAGFKDLKKTVGEEGRLIDFYDLEERIQKDIFESETTLEKYKHDNTVLMADEGTLTGHSPQYQELFQKIVPLKAPHDFYNLSAVNQTVYQRDHVWPGWIIETLGRMASGDTRMLQLKNVKATGLLGDGFDVMKIMYLRDPDKIPDSEFKDIQTAVMLDKELVLGAPWMFGGKSVGSIGLDTWRAHVIAARALHTQYDTGEGGYPTCFFLNRNGEPIFITEPDIQLIKPYFQHDHHYSIKEIKEILYRNTITENNHPAILKALQPYPDLQTFLFYAVVDKPDEPFISTELKTGLFGVTKETIQKSRRIVIAYSQGAKMGIGGHILAKKVNKLVSYLRGIEGIEYLDTEKIQDLANRIEKISKDHEHVLNSTARQALPHIMTAQDDGKIFPALKEQLSRLQQQIYSLHQENKIDPIEFEQILHLCEEVISYSYTSIISPFPFHNCYSIEDVKAFIDIVRMINPRAVISVKVSPSVDIEFIAAGLGRIAKDNTEELIRAKMEQSGTSVFQNGEKRAEYIRQYGMKIEVWLDGPRGGTGASPNIIKGQMGMHIEYAIPLIHDRLVRDDLRNYVKFFVSGGIRTYEDVIKAVALGADGVIWGTAPLVAIGCDRNRNCHDGCSRGIATSNLIMQNLRDVEVNSKQMINAFMIMQMQLIRALAGLGLQDIRTLRGRFDKIQWLGLKERVDFRIRQRREFNASRKFLGQLPHPTGQSNCGVAAIIGTEKIPSYILDKTLQAMKNRGMDGVGVGKTLCFPEYPDHYAYRLMVKGILQPEMEEWLRSLQKENTDESEIRKRARNEILKYRTLLADLIGKVFMIPYFDYAAAMDSASVREFYKNDTGGNERDYREFGNPNTDPGDIFRYFIRVKKEILKRFIEDELLTNSRYTYIREYFPEVTLQNYPGHSHFMQKAEDLFVFDHTLALSQILYVWDIPADMWPDYVKKNSLLPHEIQILIAQNPLSLENLEKYGDLYLRLLRQYVNQYRPADNKDKYIPRSRKIAVVMSAGKNFAVWKTAGREIPWNTPSAPNNIIHVRLATGSIVEQMNAHPFAKLHTALTHNGETTNYETLKQRVEQFGLPPLATTDTEVASLKFHLLAEELEYPDWALFESFSPTTGDDLALLPPELRHNLEEVQRVEFTSSPDGPYQYLCLRHNPEKNITERVDLKDPADLRPNVSAFWIDTQSGKKRAFSMIASEEQAIQRMLQYLDQEKLTDGAAPDTVMVTNGMISRYYHDEAGKIKNYEFFDRYGQPISIPDPGKHYSVRHNHLQYPSNKEKLLQEIRENTDRFKNYVRLLLPEWDFNTYRWVLTQLASGEVGIDVLDQIDILTYFMDYLRTMNSGDKAKSSILDITRFILYELFDRLEQPYPDLFSHSTIDHLKNNSPADPDRQILLVDASGFLPDGTDPQLTLAVMLARAYEQGWRKFILYRVTGQRLVSPAVMGKSDTDDVRIEVYGTPGEYLGAFMQGGLLRVHGNAQNFAAMCMHHGELQIFGNAGKVCGYASKGGKVFILGDINDRAWTNSVNDSRCQDLQIHILGSASKYAGESLMGGDFFFGGLKFDTSGKLITQERPYRGTKLLGGASRGRFLFFDPDNKLDPHQYVQGQVNEINNEDWKYWQKRIEETLVLAGIELGHDHTGIHFTADGKEYPVTRQYFKLITARGGLRGYESH